MKSIFCLITLILSSSTAFCSPAFELFMFNSPSSSSHTRDKIFSQNNSDTLAAIQTSGSNKAQILRALKQVPKRHDQAMIFLINNMPERDLQTLKASFLLENCNLAYTAKKFASWRDIPDEIFLNDVLPYACLNEVRDSSRKMLRAVCWPLIQGCKSPGEAAMKLNAKIFPLFKVRYSTDRAKPDQNCTETIASGKATCTGLSILLVMACRSVGIPARVAGTPMWMNMKGNHTWVEVWDDGWHFMGAAEPDAQGLDHSWFIHDASLALKDVPEHAIYASSFKKTGLSYPLVWDESIKWVSAVNVTERYQKAEKVANTKVRMKITVLDVHKKRIVSKVTLQKEGSADIFAHGFTRGETADLNDKLVFEIPRAVPPIMYQLIIENEVIGKVTLTIGLPNKINGLSMGKLILKMEQE